MMKAILWIIVIVLLALLAKRIFSGLVGVIVFAIAIFFAIFMLDTFTVVNVRDYINIGFYDETRKNPKETAEKVIEGTKEAGQVAVDKINDIGDKANDRYNTQSIVDMEAINNSTVVSEDSQEEDYVEEEKPKKEPVEDVKQDKPKLKLPKSNNKDAPQIEGYTYYPIKEQNSIVKSFKGSMTERDLALLKSLTPFITVTYEGDNYTFHTQRGVKGFYIQPKT